MGECVEEEWSKRIQRDCRRDISPGRGFGPCPPATAPVRPWPARSRVDSAAAGHPLIQLRAGLDVAAFDFGAPDDNAVSGIGVTTANSRTGPSPTKPPRTPVANAQ